MIRPAPLCFGPETVGDLDESTRREWLETNGIGGFACGTLGEIHTRRYHGWLTAATRPPSGRMVLLSKLEETLLVDGVPHELGANRYPGTVHPRGFERLQTFIIDPFPTWTFVADGVALRRTVFMIHGQNTTVVEYDVDAPADRHVELRVRPLIAFRDYHSLTHENTALSTDIRRREGGSTIHPYADLPALHFVHRGAEPRGEAFWYRRFEYPVELERGLDFTEDLFSPFELTWDLSRGAGCRLVSSIEDLPDDLDDAALSRAERERRVAAAAPVHVAPLVNHLSVAAEHYIVRRGDRRSIIAGYPWFTDWGRDTMIALPGLTLATGRFDDARDILEEFAAHVDQGMLPNRFPDAGEQPEYNTIDATLWYFEAVRALVQATGDYPYVQARLYGALKDIVAWHERGTRYGIRVDDDGLLLSSDPAVQLTWMDAKIGDWVVTPRNGKAVEIQALWYNALRTMQDLAVRFDDADHLRFARMADRTASAFNALFWDPELGYLADTVDGGRRDMSLRPNQIFAVSLHHSMVPPDRASRIVDVVYRELWTPYGLRSLAPSDARYRGRYLGGPEARDASYHQGPVWPWLMGPFIDAWLRVHSHTAEARGEVRQWLSGLTHHLLDAGVGHVSEILDGDAPHSPRGCFAQAWSVSEILRVAVDVFRDNAGADVHSRFRSGVPSP